MANKWWQFWEPGSWRWFWQKEPEELDEQGLFRRLQKKGCVVCDDNPKFSVVQGPTGGMSQNVWCPECWTRYNITIFGPKTGIAEIIQEREGPETAIKLGYWSDSSSSEG